jgi:hypothetical protein
MRRSLGRLLSRDDANRFFGCSFGRFVASSQEMAPLCRRSPRCCHSLREVSFLSRDGAALLLDLSVAWSPLLKERKPLCWLFCFVLFCRSFSRDDATLPPSSQEMMLLYRLLCWSLGPFSSQMTPLCRLLCRQIRRLNYRKEVASFVALTIEKKSLCRWFYLLLCRAFRSSFSRDFYRFASFSVGHFIVG